MNNW